MARFPWTPREVPDHRISLLHEVPSDPPPTATDPWRHAYFRQIPIEQAIRFSFERHTVYQFTPLLGGMYDLDVFRLVTGPDGPTLEWAPAPGSPASGFSI